MFKVIKFIKEVDSNKLTLKAKFVADDILQKIIFLRK